MFTSFFFFFNDTAPTEIYTLSLTTLFRSTLAPAQSIYIQTPTAGSLEIPDPTLRIRYRSEEHTSELQSHSDLVCRLLLEKKKIRSAKSSVKHKCPIAYNRSRPFLPQ